MNGAQIKELYNKVPRAVKIFLLRALIIFVVWQSLYYFILAPNRIPDRALTNFTCYSTSRLLSLFYKEITPIYIIDNTQRDALILKEGKRVVAIGDPCNALDIYVLYVSFLFCFPGSARRRLLFIAAGIPCIYIFNIVRAALITWMNIAHHGWADISHHYIFTTIMYVIVFYGWILYSKKGFREIQS